MKINKYINLYKGDSLKFYDKWDCPTVIVADGPYGIGGFPGDPLNVDVLAEWYLPHIKKWSALSTPNTTLWFWNTELGWASVHKTLVENGWDFVNCHIWDKGKEHIAGNTNTKTLRKLPVVTEVCVQYVKRAIFNVNGENMSIQEWLRYEWARTGLPFSKTNEACGVKNAATRKYFTSCHLWYYPPVEAFQKIVDYANEHGLKNNKPYFSINGKTSLTGDEWAKMRSKFTCPFGITNVWRKPPLNGKERLKEGGKALHFNQKPLELMELIISCSSEENDIVWEPFGGLFSASIAAANLKRIAFASEITPEVFERGKTRALNL